MTGPELDQLTHHLAILSEGQQIWPEFADMIEQCRSHLGVPDRITTRKWLVMRKRQAMFGRPKDADGLTS